MKHTHLSNFQKEQYTNYLETQLQKFSAFMLSQRKENDRYKHLECIIAEQGQTISTLQSKMELMEVYQSQHVQNSQHLHKKISALPDLDQRIRRIEDKYTNVHSLQTRNRGMRSFKEQKDESLKEIQSNISKLQRTCQQITKRIKLVEEENSCNREFIANIMKTKNDQIDNLSTEEVSKLVEKKELKKLQKKMQKYFSCRFEEIEHLIRKVKRQRSKSPLAVTPITHLNHQSEQTNKMLSQFRIDDNYSIGKSQFSTVSRQSKNTIIQSRERAPIMKRKNSKKDSRKHSKSVSFSDNSILKSSISRSKSKSKGPSCNISLSKKQKKKSQKDRSASKSRHSSISHEKCKQSSYTILQQKRQPRQKREVSPLRHKGKKV